MKHKLAFNVLFLFGFVLLVQGAPDQRAAMRSVSGQFVIHDQRGVTGSHLPAAGPDQQLLDLEPPFLVVSCERIKQALYETLGANRNWRGTIHATIRPVRSSQDVAQINVE